MKRSRGIVAVYGAAFAAALGLHLGLAVVLGGLLGAGADRGIPEAALTGEQQPLAVSFVHPEPVELQPKAAAPVTRLRQPELQAAPDPSVEPPLLEPPDPQAQAAVSEIRLPDIEPAGAQPPEVIAPAPGATDSPAATASRPGDALPVRGRGAAPPVVRVLKPRPLSRIDAEAVYPLGSRLRGEEGLVRLSVMIDAAGRIQLLEVVGSSGFAALDRAAEKAVRQTRFAPAVRDGHPISDELIIAIRFRLES